MAGNGHLLLRVALGLYGLFSGCCFIIHPQNHPSLTRSELDYILSDNEPDQSGKISWKALFKYRPTYAIVLSRFITDWVWWFILFWIPDFLNKMHNINIKELVLPLIVIYSFAGLGGIAGGWLSSRFIKNRKIH